MRLLVVIASPSDEVPLDAAAEKERIAAALQPLTKQGMIEVSYLEGPDTWERLLEELLPNRTHILHFIGHGAFDEDMGEGVLVMEDSEGRAQRINSERLRYLVQGKSRLRLVVLNSCLGTEGNDATPFSSMAAGLVRSGIPAVIAMQFEISDNAARKIAQTFYTSLALNLPVDAALTEARRKIFLSDTDSLEWATPILYMQVPNGQLFEFDLDAKLIPSDGGDTNPPPPETMDVLAVLVPTDAGEEIRLGERTIKIGRSPDNDVVLLETTVSRKQATLTRSGATYKIENVGASSTFVNGKAVTRSAILKDHDLIRLGALEFEFRSLAEMVKGSVVNPQMTAGVVAADAFKTRAESRYQDGEKAIASGDWAKAVEAFKGALFFVPGYRDATQKLATCENCEKAVKQYGLAQQLCSDKKYYQALQALTSAAKLDPSLGDQAGIRSVAECGQKYGRALGELQMGNRDAAAALLREVISCQPDFEDAAERLEGLAQGQDGLDGLQPVRSNQEGAVAPPIPAGSGPQARLYDLANADAGVLAEELRQYFFTDGYESQIFQHAGTWIVQGKKEGLRSWVGMGLAATVTMDTTSSGLKISIGGGKWVEQGVAMGVGGFLTGGALFITAGIGLAQQKALMDTLWLKVGSFVQSRGGRRVG